jgi:hypothetical protein
MSSSGAGADNDIVALYDGAYGRTIRLAIDREATLQRLKAIFLSLAEGDQTHVELVSAVFPLNDQAASIVIDAVLVEDESGAALTVQRGAEPAAAFLWALSRAGWLRCAGLVEGLLDHGEPSHQYLTEEGVDDALIELAYRE